MYETITVIFGFNWVLYKFKLIGWVIETRKYAAAGGDKAFFVIGTRSEIVIHVLEFYLSIVPYNFHWIFVNFDIIIFMYYV